MRASLSLLAYVPSIKFVGGAHPIRHVAAGVHACAPDGLIPSKEAPRASATMEFQSRNNLSARFRYRQPDDIEMENVLAGGAEIVYKQL